MRSPGLRVAGHVVKPRTIVAYYLPIAPALAINSSRNERRVWIYKREKTSGTTLMADERGAVRSPSSCAGNDLHGYMARQEET
jgi:hypothetical protein